MECRIFQSLCYCLLWNHSVTNCHNHVWLEMVSEWCWPLTSTADWCHSVYLVVNMSPWRFGRGDHSPMFDLSRHAMDYIKVCVCVLCVCVCVCCVCMCVCACIISLISVWSVWSHCVGCAVHGVYNCCHSTQCVWVALPQQCSSSCIRGRDCLLKETSKEFERVCACVCVCVCVCVCLVEAMCITALFCNQ